jgi:thiosulfate reductase cytochrome b subunit
VAPAHNLGSWLFISFFVMHLYLITTGHTPASSLKAMITGYEEIETEEKP